MTPTQKPPASFVCLYCGRTGWFIGKFTAVAAKRKFCDRACADAYRKAHPERSHLYIHGQFVGNGRRNYGPNWKHQVARARKRDNYTCQHCGKEQHKPAFDVHHIKRFVSFGGDWETANELSNLITLCKSCHSGLEAGLITLQVRLDLGKMTIEDYSDPHSGMMKLECAQCGVTFVRHRGKIKSDLTYCSTECLQASQDRKVERECAHCGTTFLRSPSGMVHEKVFCCKACYTAYRPAEKRCPKCDTVKPLSKFSSHGKSYHPHCKSCTAYIWRIAQITRYNVSLAGNPADERYRCNTCGTQWSPKIAVGKKHMRGWWRCPNDCNAASARYPSQAA